jgi:hypothetical protein
LKPRENLDRALEDAVSRALRDNLAPLQRTANELHQAYADLVAACASTRPSNALPAMLRAQTAAAALAAGLSVLSNFVAVALNPKDGDGTGSAAAAVAGEAVAETAERQETSEGAPEKHSPQVELEDWAAAEQAAAELAPANHDAEVAPAHLPEAVEAPVPAAASAAAEKLSAQVEASVAEAAPFDLATLPVEMQDLHRRANRVAKVAMQDIKLLRPKDVQAGRDHKDLCDRLRLDLDKARKEYDRRFRAISDHPVDYFHHWALEILAGGDTSALGEYPYPSTVLRH